MMEDCTTRRILTPTDLTWSPHSEAEAVEDFPLDCQSQTLNPKPVSWLYASGAAGCAWPSKKSLEPNENKSYRD